MSGFPKIRGPHHKDHIHILGSVIDPSFVGNLNDTFSRI